MKYVEFFRRIFRHYKYGHRLEEEREIETEIVFEVWTYFDVKRHITITSNSIKETDKDIIEKATYDLDLFLNNGYKIDDIESLFITVYTFEKFGKDNAFYIKVGENPIYESEVEFCCLALKDTEMISPEYKISQCRCVCVSVPSVRRLFHLIDGENPVITIEPGSRTRIFQKKTGIKRRREWKPYDPFMSKKFKKIPIKLEAGETKIFGRKHGLRGTSIHSIITTQRNISKVPGG